MPRATASMLIFGPNSVIGANLLSSPKGLRNGACGGCARAALEASRTHRKRSEADNETTDRTGDAMSCSLLVCSTNMKRAGARPGSVGRRLHGRQWTVLRTSCRELRQPPTILPWPLPDVLHEDAREVRRIVEADRVGDALELRVGLQQQAPGNLDADLGHVVLDANSDFRSEPVREMAGRNMDRVGERADAQRHRGSSGESVRWPRSSAFGAEAAGNWVPRSRSRRIR